ncbi:MAG: 5-methyltetrahydropteroyltriglutamate--homocysteine methyltransferase, partial [Lentisphaeria bacterium]|nr:5-methyltetrahydropteroyltriglutamate--homocysteine methyltransferase [Lentisphaeria bacterium]
TPAAIIARVEEAMRHVDRSRIALHPDCGFAPSVQNPMDLDEAYLKLKAMAEAAVQLRDKYG